MAPIKSILILATIMGLSLLVECAPTETTTLTSNESTSPASQTTVPPQADSNVTPQADSTTSTTTHTISAPSVDPKESTLPTTPDQHPKMITNFTCYGRPLGYYADTQHNCSVYHFCLLGEYAGQSVYQRITYKCLNNTFFDQQALDCLAQSAMSAACAESETYYESSNAVLRQAVVEAYSPQSTGNVAGAQQVTSVNSSIPVVA